MPGLDWTEHNTGGDDGLLLTAPTTEGVATISVMSFWWDTLDAKKSFGRRHAYVYLSLRGRQRENDNDRYHQSYRFIINGVPAGFDAAAIAALPEAARREAARTAILAGVETLKEIANHMFAPGEPPQWRQETVVTDYMWVDTIDRAKKALAEGWEPQGGVAVGDGRTVQAMVRRVAKTDYARLLRKG